MICEFCGDDVDFAEGNEFHGLYCRRCCLLSITADKEAIRNIINKRREAKERK